MPADDLSVDEVQRGWDLPGDHPDSWVQRNATYRMIWEKASFHSAETLKKAYEAGFADGLLSGQSGAAALARLRAENDVLRVENRKCQEALKLHAEEREGGGVMYE